MSNYGLGIGSFMDGLVKGAQVRRQMDRDKFDQEMAQKKFDLTVKQDDRAANQQTFDQDLRTKDFGLRQGQDTRAAKMDEFNLSRAKSDQSYIEGERAADAPVKAAQRKSVLTTFADADEQRTKLRTAGAEADKAYADKKAASIKVDTGADGKQTYSMDGKAFPTEQEATAAFEQRHGTAMDNYHRTVVPQVERMKVQAGDIQGAEAWRKWNEDARVRKGIDTAGRLEMAFRSGDWDAVNQHFNTLTQNKDYMAMDGHEVKTEPLKNASGQTVGIKGVYTNKQTGETTTKEYKDLGALHTELMGMVNPASVFEWNKQQLDAKRAAEAKMAEENNKTGNQIILEKAKAENTIDNERVKSALKIAEERSKGGGLGVTREQYAKGVVDMHQKLRDARAFRKKGADGKPVEMSIDEQMTLADSKYRELLARAGAPSQVAPAPQRRPTLMSRPAAVAPVAPAPAAAPVAPSEGDE